MSKQLKIPPGVGLGGGVKFLIYFWEVGGGGNLDPPPGYTLDEPSQGPVMMRCWRTAWSLKVNEVSQGR